MDFVSKEDFSLHAQSEEVNQRVMNDALHEGNLRMGSIEASVGDLSNDMKPLKALYNAVVGASAIGTIAVALLLYIYTGAQDRLAEDRSNIKSLAESVQKHTVILEKVVMSHQELEKDTTKEFQRIEKVLERLPMKGY